MKCRNCGAGEENGRTLYAVDRHKFEHGSLEQCVRELQARLERLEKLLTEN